MQLQAAIDEVKEIWDSEPSKGREEVEVINKYADLFKSENLHLLSGEDFKSFLNYKNNKHWKNLERAGYRLAEDMTLLRRTLRILLDESIPIEMRIKRIRDKTSPDYLPWFGPAYYTLILLITNPLKYPVVNSIVKYALEKLGLYFDYDSKEEWVAYSEASSIIIRLSKENHISLWQIDWVWWEISKSFDHDKLFDFINKKNKISEINHFLIIRTLLQKDFVSKEELNQIIRDDTTTGLMHYTTQNYDKLIDEYRFFTVCFFLFPE